MKGVTGVCVAGPVTYPKAMWIDEECVKRLNSRLEYGASKFTLDSARRLYSMIPDPRTGALYDLIRYLRDKSPEFKLRVAKNLCGSFSLDAVTRT